MILQPPPTPTKIDLGRLQDVAWFLKGVLSVKGEDPDGLDHTHETSLVTIANFVAYQLTKKENPT